MKKIDIAEGYRVVCLCGAPVVPTDDSQVRTISLGPDAETAAVVLVTLLCDAHKDAPQTDIFIGAIRYVAGFHQKALVVE